MWGSLSGFIVTMAGGDCGWEGLFLGVVVAGGRPWQEASSAQGLGSRYTPVFGGKEGRDGGMYILHRGICQSFPSSPSAAPKLFLLLATVIGLCDDHAIQAGQKASRKAGT